MFSMQIRNELNLSSPCARPICRSLPERIICSRSRIGMRARFGWRRHAELSRQALPALRRCFAIQPVVFGIVIDIDDPADQHERQVVLCQTSPVRRVAVAFLDNPGEGAASQFREKIDGHRPEQALDPAAQFRQARDGSRSGNTEIGADRLPSQQK